jgi:hypothetical protein
MRQLEADPSPDELTAFLSEHHPRLAFVAEQTKGADLREIEVMV